MTLVRLSDILEVFKISKPTIYRWIEKGCPVHRIGSIPYFDAEEISNWIKENEEVK